MAAATDLARLRGASQALHRPARLRDPVDVVRSCGPLQAQEPRAAKLAFRARARDLRAADVDVARTEERSLLRAWVMRKTVHLIATEDAGWMVPLFADATVRWSRRRLARLGLDRDRQDRALALMREAVDREGPLTRSELAERLRPAGFMVTDQIKTHLWLLATLDGELCLGPDRGGYACLVRTAEWVGPLEPRPREQALAELARRYFTAYAPASERDFARWSQLSLGEARTGVAAIADELTEVQVDGETLLRPRRMKRAGAEPVVRLLGAFDNYNLGYENRDFQLPAEHARQVAPGGGIVRPTITVDGRIVGTWSSKRHGKRLAVTLEPFVALGPEVEKALADEVADLGRFEGVEATLAG